MSRHGSHRADANALEDRREWDGLGHAERADVRWSG